MNYYNGICLRVVSLVCENLGFGPSVSDSLNLNGLLYYFEILAFHQSAQYIPKHKFKILRHYKILTIQIV